MAGAYEFDPDEDDMDDELEEQDEKGGDTLEEVCMRACQKSPVKLAP